MGSPPDDKYRKDYNGEQVLTADRVEITEGLRVFTIDLETGRIDLSEAEYEWHGGEDRYVLWFRVILDKDPSGRGVMQSDDRVATRFDGRAA